MARGVTSEWEDIHVARGNWAPVEKPPTSEEVFQENLYHAEYYDYKDKMTEKQLEEKAEDDFDFDEDDFMKEYRAKKMAEMKVEASKP